MERKFNGTKEDRIILNLVYDKALNEFHINKFKLESTFNQIKEFCIQKDRATFEYLWKYLIASKLLKNCSFDVESLKEEAHEINEEFERLLKELNKTAEEESEKENETTGNQF